MWLDKVFCRVVVPTPPGAPRVQSCGAGLRIILLLVNRGVCIEFRWVWLAFPRWHGPWLLLVILVWAPAPRAFRWVVVSRVIIIRRTSGMPARMPNILVGNLMSLVVLLFGAPTLTDATATCFL